MKTIDLGGRWVVYAKGSEERFPAEVPGGVHNDLLRDGRIPDPFFRDNEKDVAWVGESDWVYERVVRVPRALLEHDRVLLVCEGLDTIATIRLNGKKVAATDNMFRQWEFDVKPFLRPGVNTLSVTFTSALTYTRRMNRKHKLPGWGIGSFRLDSGGWIRKQPCNFGWDWGIRLVTCGIWRPIRLVACEGGRLTDMEVRQRHARGAVTLDVAAEVENTRRASLECQVRVSLRGNLIAEVTAPVRAGRGKAKLVLRGPELWWPNGMGAQPLYDVSVRLLDREGRVLDSKARRIGLRTLRLERKQDRWGESFQFVVNGKAFFAKGANWIPADAILARLGEDAYRRLVDDAAAAHMNMLRVWGGGIYEADCFYDACDEAGICVWQDFMFACGTYPAFDEAFLANVKAEAEDNVRRLRHHACLALWCGNNELEQGLVGETWTEWRMSWEDYGKLFDMLLPEIVKRLAPDTDYWPCSPHSPCGDRSDHRNPRCGDAHLWDVWHGRKPFEWYRTCEHRFNSEFGFQSFPEPAVVAGYTYPEDRNITAPIMEWHQRSGIGNVTIMQYMLDWFQMPDSFDNTLWLSQVLQGMAMKYAVEHWRRGMPRGMGTLYWQLNDCWPVASWSSIDYAGNWKALHYMARRFYAPVLVSAVESADTGRVAVHVTNDRVRPFAGRLKWSLTTTDGRRLAEQATEVEVGERRSARVERLDLSEVVGCHGAENLLLWLDLVEGRKVISSDTIMLARPKRMPLCDPGLVGEVRTAGKDAFRVRLQASAPALWTWLALEGTRARYSDNFFHLRGKGARTVVVWPERALSLKAFKQGLRVRSLIDTYR